VYDVGLKEGSAELERAEKSARSRSIFSIPTDMSQYGGPGLPLFLRRDQGLPSNTFQSIQRGDTMAHYTRITRRHFLAGTVAAGVALAGADALSAEDEIVILL